MPFNRYILPIASTLIVSMLLTVNTQADDQTEKKAAGEKASSKSDSGTATATNGTPKIDGEVDEIWKNAKAVKVAKPIEGLLLIDEEDMATATVKLLWDKDHLYALWRVTDSKLSDVGDNPWEHDSVELFVDQNKKATAFYEDDDAQYRVSYKSELSGQGEGYDVKNIKAKAKATKKGYLVEMAIKIKDVELKPDTKLGLELQVNDNSGDETRGAVAKWHHTEDDSWESTSDFGTLLIK